MSFEPFVGTWFGDDTPTITPDAAIGLDGTRVLAPLLTTDGPAVADQVGVARTLARASDGALRLTDLLGDPRTDDCHWHGGTDTDAAVDPVEWALDRVEPAGGIESGDPTRGRPVRAVLHIAAANDVDTVVLPRVSPGGVFGGDIAERIATHAECDVVVVNGKPGYGPVPSILLPIAGGPHSGLATDVAARIAADCGAWIDVLHVVPEDPTTDRRERAETHVEAAADRIGRPEATTTWVLEAQDVPEAIVEQSQYYDLCVVGAPTTGRLRRLVFGSTNRTVRANARSVVLSVRTHGDTADLSQD